MRRKRSTDHLLEPGQALVKVEPGDDGATTGISGLVLPRQDQEVRGLAGLEQAGFALELFLRGARTRIGGDDSLPPALNALQGVPDLSLNPLFYLSLLQPQALFGNQALSKVSVSRAVAEVEIDLHTGLDGLITATKHVPERSAITADQKVGKRAGGDQGKRVDTGDG